MYVWTYTPPVILHVPEPSTDAAPMTRAAIREVLKRHPGSLATLADELEVTVTIVSLVLRNKRNSERVLKAAEQRAKQFLEREALNAR